MLPEYMDSDFKKRRVLFTGNGTLAINGLIKRLPEGYEAESCLVVESAIAEALERFDPHTLVICLLKETERVLLKYNILEREKKYANLPIIAIGNEEDCEVFRGHYSRIFLSIMLRPLNNQTFFETLSRYTSMAQEKDGHSAAFGLPMERQLEEIANMQVKVAEGFNVKKPAVTKAVPVQSRRTILVVDDDVRILNVVKLYLQDLFEVVAVPSGRLALKYLSKHSADLVLLDYMMPDEDGPAVLRQIRKDSPNPDIPVLFLTGVADKESVMRGLESHPDGYCLKPVTRETLIERIATVLLNL